MTLLPSSMRGRRTGATGGASGELSEAHLSDTVQPWSAHIEPFSARRLYRLAIRSSPSLIAYSILVVLGGFWLTPLLWPVLASLSRSATLALAIPTRPTLENYGTLIGSDIVQQPFFNSFILAGTTMVLVVILASLAAYPLSRYKFPFKGTLMYLILFTSALPVLAIVTPLYSMYVQLGLVDSMAGVVLFFTASALPFSIWLMKNFFDSVPRDLEEAAWVDGASIFSALLRVIVPLTGPGIAVVAIWSFLGAWTNFFVPLILLQSQNLQPAAVQIYTFFGAYGQVNYGQLAAYACLYALPVLILYASVSRFFVKGLGNGAIKG